MSKLPGLRRLFRLAAGRAPIEADVDAEIGYHLEATTQEFLEAGLSPDEARRAALRRFGDVAGVRAALGSLDRTRHARERRREQWRSFGADIAQAARSLVREPAFTLTVALTLSLGIGANATMFGVVDRLLLRPPAHVRDDGRLSLIYFQRETPEFGRVYNTSASYPVFTTLRQLHQAFDDVAAFWRTEMSLGRGTSARKINVSLVTPNFFPILGVGPVAGRFFTQDEWKEPPVKPAIVSAGFAEREFGSVGGALGKKLELNTQIYTIVGVSPAGFTGVRPRAADAFVPIAAAAASQASPKWETTNNMRWIEIVAHRAAGVTTQQASSAATTAYRNVERERQRGDTTASVVAGSSVAARRPEGTAQGRIAAWLAAVSAVVLLIACANVANLLLARASRRRREFAVRVALGVARSRLAAQLLVESVMLAATGGVFALLIARWGGLALRATLLKEFAWDDSAVDWRVAVFTAAVILATALLAGLAPAVTSSCPNLGDALKSGAREGGGRRSRLRSLLIVTQAALSVMLLVGAGLFAASFRRATTLDIGMDADRIVLARPDFSAITRDSATYEERWREAVERVRAVPGVTSVSQSVTTPFESQWTADVYTTGNGKLPPLKGGGPYGNAVTPEYFTTMGTTLLRGRAFAPTDVQGAPPVTIINEAMARAIWPGQEALGRCFMIDADTVPCTTVVGIVRNSRMTELKEAPPPHYYLPLAQWSPDMRMLFVRVEREPERFVKDVREKLQSISSLLPYTDVRTMGEVIEPELRPWRLGAMMFGLFGLLAFVVAVLGTYSVVAYEVSQRRREIGVRMALGARSGQVLRGVIGDGLRQASVGVAVGILLALVATRWLGDLLFQTSPREPAIYAGVALLLLSAAAVASLVPAREAARLDPAEVLKGE